MPQVPKAMCVDHDRDILYQQLKLRTVKLALLPGSELVSCLSTWTIYESQRLSGRHWVRLVSQMYPFTRSLNDSNCAAGSVPIVDSSVCKTSGVPEMTKF